MDGRPYDAVIAWSTAVTVPVEAETRRTRGPIDQRLPVDFVFASDLYGHFNSGVSKYVDFREQLLNHSTHTLIRPQ